MADATCKICRRAGEKLFLKGEKCFTAACVFNKRPHAPGKLATERKHRSVVSEYGKQLREKQKVRNIYGLSEHQFQTYVKDVVGRAKNPSEALLEKLESRLDNVVYRLGLAVSRPLARQMVVHGHIVVNGRHVNVPSYMTKTGDVVTIREGSRTSALFKDLEEKMKNHHAPSWVSFDPKKGEGKVVSKPKAGDTLFNLGSVLEFYSR